MNDFKNKLLFISSCLIIVLSVVIGTGLQDSNNIVKEKDLQIMELTSKVKELETKNLILKNKENQWENKEMSYIEQIADLEYHKGNVYGK